MKHVLLILIGICLIVGSVIAEGLQKEPAFGIVTTNAGQISGINRTNASTAIRPFSVHIPEAALVDLHQRAAATSWPDKETVADQSQGVQLATMKEIARYWATDYDWRKVEARLNALPMYTTNIDGVDIQFIHVKSRNSNALPIIITHGWPGSIIEQLNIIDPLTNPTAHGGRAEDAFDVVIPSMPGYGFSGKPTTTGWDANHVARAWAELMKRLGYTRYVAAGGDEGALVSEAMARQAPAGLLGIHVNLPLTFPPEVTAGLFGGAPAPTGMSQKEKAAYAAIAAGIRRGYFVEQSEHPQTIGYALTDSPIGLAAWMLDHDADSYKKISQAFLNGLPSGNLIRDNILDDITLYWLTNSSTSAARLYWENSRPSPTSGAVQKTNEISLPVAITVFPGEIYQYPETWARRAYRNLTYFHEVDKGGHYAAWEEPELYSAELRAAFRSLR